MIRNSANYLVCIRLFLRITLSSASEYQERYLAEDGLTDSHDVENEAEPAFAVLFPPFYLTIGVVVFYLLSRYIKALPYTAVMFLIGILSGIGASVGNFRDHIHESLLLWVPINSEVLLLVFLPGLIFRDAMSQSVHLFWFSLPQLLIFAFPMVLGGTALTALIGYKIFPYGWSLDLALTFGSILAATDPVAVAALLEEVGAPPRLKVHVAGESLLNDGSAIVFFTIFSERFFYELGIPELGEDIDLKKGIALFCRKALGGVAVGWFFGCLLLLVWFMLDRKFSREENVVQVTATIALVYLNYYVADFVWKTSGVIATVAAGLQVKLLGKAMINDSKLLDDFMSIVEHILNTLLFTLGGVVWGAVIVDGEERGIWGPKDWGYLILLYVLLQVVRGFLFCVAYPLTKTIGLKTNWKETMFQVYGGLRGAVGIALAIALDNEVEHATGAKQSEIVVTEEIQTTQVFIMVGGIAFLTLVINGTTAGPLLRSLGLADSTDTRQKIVAAYKVHFRARAIEDFVRLLTQRRFRHVNFALVRHHVPYLADLTKQQLFEAVEKHKESTPRDHYLPPFLDNVLPYLEDDEVVHFNFKEDQPGGTDDETKKETAIDHERKIRMAERTRNRRQKRVSANVRFMIGGEPLSATELRALFVSILKGAFDKQIKTGELDDEHILSISLLQNLEFVADHVANGGKLNDWENLTKIHEPLYRATQGMKGNRLVSWALKLVWYKRSQLGLKEPTHIMFIERSIAVMAAHKAAQAFFKAEFQDVDSELSEAGKIVMEESKHQYNLAEKALQDFDQRIVKLAVSHKFCKILLTMGVFYIEDLVKVNLLKESEAEHFVEEQEHHLNELLLCGELYHPGELESIETDTGTAGGNTESINEA